LEQVILVGVYKNEESGKNSFTTLILLYLYSFL